MTKALNTTKTDELVWQHTALDPAVISAIRLLTIQGGALFFVGSFFLFELTQSIPTLSAIILGGLQSSLLFNIIFLLLAILAWMAGFSFSRRQPSAWMNAMLVQGLTLLLCLFLYRYENLVSNVYPRFIIFSGMISSIFMVVYLHNPKIKATAPDFRAGKNYVQSD